MYHHTYECRGHVQSLTVCSTFRSVLLLRHISVGCTGCTGSGPTFCTVRMT